MAFNWTCPFCDRPQTVTEQNVSSSSFPFHTVLPHDGHIGLAGQCIVCSNPYCRKATVRIFVLRAVKDNLGNTVIPKKHEVILSQRIVPDSAARPQPEFIPAVLRQDYEEACKILEKSPKASATLARRCLQGMIRDFCEISKNRLIDEINELMARVENDRAPKGVSDDSVEAIDAVRKIGNIGAHMEKDINVIIDVDPDEAQVLIELIETLFEEWYVARDKRKERFSRLHLIASAKDEQKKITQEPVAQIEAPKKF